MENLCASFHSFYNSINTLLPIGTIEFIRIAGLWLIHTLYPDADTTRGYMKSDLHLSAIS
jgi:hypothetical protein